MGVKNYKILLFLIMVLVLIKFSSAIDININIKSSFQEGSDVYFEYSLLSESFENVVFYPHIKCPSAPLPFVNKKEISLEPNIIYNGVYSSFRVDKSIEPQTCTAYLQILQPYQKIVKRDFLIETNPSFNFRLDLCKDSLCNKKSKIFSKGETIYFNFYSDVENPVLNINLIYPSRNSEKIPLPFNIKAEKNGVYMLEVIASKDGYKEVSKKENFAVIEKELEIKKKIFEEENINFINTIVEFIQSIF